MQEPGSASQDSPRPTWSEHALDTVVVVMGEADVSSDDVDIGVGERNVDAAVAVVGCGGGRVRGGGVFCCGCSRLGEREKEGWWYACVYRVFRVHAHTHHTHTHTHTPHTHTTLQYVFLKNEKKKGV